MREWMGYECQQQALPNNFTGVPVSITAIDPNGNYITIGTATTEANGLFHYIWAAPNIPGGYSVYAIFGGTNGYWPSSAETNLVVQSAHEATPAPTATPTSVADAYFVPAIAGLFVLIIIVLAVVMVLMLRKRPYKVLNKTSISPFFVLKKIGEEMGLNRLWLIMIFAIVIAHLHCVLFS